MNDVNESTSEPTLNDEGTNTLWRIGLVGGIVLYVSLSLIYILIGQLNADEGFYLLASKLVFQGHIPYRDFAFTQMPLLPYIYGIPQSLFASSIILGRATSVLFSIVAFSIWVYIGRRRAGIVGSSSIALLLATFTFGIYYLSIVKTYALLIFLFALTFFFLTFDLNREWPRVVALVFAIAATMVRLSAFPFTVVIFTHILVTAHSRRAKLAIAALGTIASLSILLLVSLDFPAAKWNLTSHHIQQWGDVSSLSKLHNVLTLRVPDLLATFLPYMLLAIVIIVYLRANSQVQAKRDQTSTVFIVGISLFGLSHFATGGWHIEYFVPVVYTLLPFLGMGFVSVYLRKDLSLNHKIILRVALFSVLISELLRGSWLLGDIAREPPIFEVIHETSEQVRASTSADDKVFALEALWLLVNSGRQSLPGMTMAQFSIFAGDTQDAKKLNLVNGELIMGHITSGEAEVVLLTDFDWETLDRIKITDQVKEELDSCYELLLINDNVTPNNGKLYAYKRMKNC